MNKHVARAELYRAARNYVQSDEEPAYVCKIDGATRNVPCACVGCGGDPYAAYDEEPDHFDDTEGA